MTAHVHKIVELVGSSSNSIEEAVQIAIERASSTVRNLRWFEVTQIRGCIENDSISRYQVILKAGFALEEGD